MKTKNPTGRARCPVCGNQLVEGRGPKNAPFLVIGEFPGKDEIIQGKAFISKTGEILMREFSRFGMDINEFRVTNLWLHAPNPKKRKKGEPEPCDPNWHLTQLAKEIKGRKAILLMGSDVTKAILGQGAMEIYGMKMESTMFPGILMMISPHPVQLMHGGMGEWRLAIERWKEMVDELS